MVDELINNILDDLNNAMETGESVEDIVKKHLHPLIKVEKFLKDMIKRHEADMQSWCEDSSYPFHPPVHYLLAKNSLNILRGEEK